MARAVNELMMMLVDCLLAEWIGVEFEFGFDFVFAVVKFPQFQM